MIVQLTNPNEYKDDDRRYIKQIRNCVCTRVDGNLCELQCKILMRGNHYYTFDKENPEYIDKSIHGTKHLWLGEEALQTVREAIAVVDKDLADLADGKYEELICDGYSLFYRQVGEKYDLILNFGEFSDSPNGRRKIFAFKHQTTVMDAMYDHWLPKLTKENFDQHPVVLFAQKQNDEAEILRLKISRDFATNDDCAQLEKLLGKRVLPKLSEKYNIDYVIDVEKMTNDDYATLWRSGYWMMHVPHFSMKNSTHEKIKVNPYKKGCTDAASVDAVAISFEDFLKIFDKNE